PKGFVSMPLVNENDVEELDLPGRHLRWVVTTENANAQHCSMCVIRVEAGEKVRPAHSHPHGEEVIYILPGSARILLDGAIEQVKAGSAVLVPQGAIHMLQNTGAEEMKAACFFAPGTKLENYVFFEDVDFPA